MSTTLSSFAGRGGNSGGMKSNKKLTKAEKDKARNSYLNKLVTDVKSGSSGRKNAYIELYNADPNKLIFDVSQDGEALVCFYDISKPGEDPIRANECYIFPPGIGMMGRNMGGIGSKFDDNDTQGGGSEFTGYSHNCIVALGLPLPSEVIETCPDVEDQVKKSIAFLEARTARFAEEAMKHESVYAAFKEECVKSADKFREEAESRDETCSDEEWNKIFKSHFTSGINLGMKWEKFTDETAKKTVKFLSVKIKSNTFRDNTGESLPEDVARELKEGKNLAIKPVAEIIKRAYDSGLKLNSLKWDGPDGQPLNASTFEPKFNNGATIIVAVKMACYSRGKNRGSINYIQKGHTVINTEYVAEDLDLHGDKYIKPKARSAHEIMLLHLFKNNAKSEDGISVDTIDKMLISTKKMSKDELARALSQLTTDKLVVKGKADNFFKLADLHLNIDLIPTIPTHKQTLITNPFAGSKRPGADNDNNNNNNNNKRAKGNDDSDGNEDDS